MNDTNLQLMIDLTENIRDLNEKDNEGNTFLHKATKTNDIKFAWYLHKLNPNMNFNICNNTNDTPLHIACKYHHMDLVEHIFRYGGKREAINNEGKKPFEYLTSKELKEINEFRDKIYGMGKYEYKPKPERKHHGLTSTAF
jgi:ankyrin repeat protein